MNLLEVKSIIERAANQLNEFSKACQTILMPSASYRKFKQYDKSVNMVMRLRRHA